jgi:hypothetical protein
VKGQESKGRAELQGKGPEWMGVRHHEKETSPLSNSGFPIILQGV